LIPSSPFPRSCNYYYYHYHHHYYYFYYYYYYYYYHHQKKGIEVARSFQQLMVDLDKPCNTQDYQGFLTLHAQAAAFYNQFFDLLSDVPDEL